MLGTLKFSSRIQYGRNKRNIPYYLFEPNDYQEDKIIVASKMGLKTKVDHYCCIEILNDTQRPNKGAILKLLGPINDYDVNKKFILLKNNINTQDAKVKYSYEQNVIVNDLCEFTYSIDPESTKDIDDAFSYDFENKILSIHITDLSDLKIDNINELIKKGFTFYDDDFNINMFPEEISEDKFSLISNQIRNTISMIVNIETGKIHFIQSQIKVNKNLTYEEADKLFLTDDKWIIMKNDLINYFGEFEDSHKFIENIMVLYNSKFGEFIELQTDKYPIRIHKGIKKDILEQLVSSDIINENLKKKICYYAAEYTNNYSADNKLHQDLNIIKYTHATSPLRRAIDVINQKIAFNKINIDIDECCTIINERNLLFKKAYNDIKLLNLINDANDNKLFDATVIGFYDFRIKVYIMDLDIIKYIDLFYDKNHRIFVVNTDDGRSLSIVHRSTQEVITLNLYQKIKLLSLVKNYESRLYKKLKFYIKEPDLITLLD
jgi:exoribonuclease R